MAAHLIRLTNGLVVQDDNLIRKDIYINTTSGKIVSGQESFYSSHEQQAVQSIDLAGQIVSPGFIDVQINGCFGLDFSAPADNYADELARVKRDLLSTGVTSFLPTLTSQRSEVYAQTLRYLGAGQDRNGDDGAESLGAHCEGPFINPLKCGIHAPDVLQKASSIADMDACYGRQFLTSPIVKMVTLAPELDASHQIIPELRSRGIIPSIGHSAATHEQALTAVAAGTSMITHLYNAMPQPHHREPGIVGLLGANLSPRPYYGLIADGHHVHPTMARVAYTAHPKGCILVTDAMSVLGLRDGRYAWTNGESFVKEGDRVTLERTGGIAGSAVSLLTCLNNLLAWTGVSIPRALATVTSTPAEMLGLAGIKGTLREGADADLVVSGRAEDGRLVVRQVWKFGKCVFRGDNAGAGAGAGAGAAGATDATGGVLEGYKSKL